MIGALGIHEAMSSAALQLSVCKFNLMASRKIYSFGSWGSCRYDLDQMAFCRGTKDDYDRWAQVTGDDGWSWDNMQEHILKVKPHSLLSGLRNLIVNVTQVDRMTAPTDHHDTTGQFDPRIHKDGSCAQRLPLLPVCISNGCLSLPQVFCRSVSAGSRSRLTHCC